MGEILQREFLVDAGDADLFGRCRPSSLQNFIQSIATEHAAALGVSRDVLVSRKNCVWILLRLKYRLFRPVLFGERLKISTWAYPPKGPLFLREFDLYAGGELVGEAASDWAVADAETHRLMRPETIAEFCRFDPPGPPKGVLLTRLRPILPQREGAPYLVSYSDLDVNGHVNNVRYADFACNAAGLEGFPDQYAAALQINFLSECFAGEQIRFFTGAEGNRLHVEGKDGADKPKFEAEIVLADGK